MSAPSIFKFPDQDKEPQKRAIWIAHKVGIQIKMETYIYIYIYIYICVLLTVTID